MKKELTFSFGRSVSGLHQRNCRFPEFIFVKNCIYAWVSIAFFLTHAFVLNGQGLLVSTTLEQRMAESELIAEGKEISQYSVWGAKINMIYTVHEIEIYKVFKGRITNNTIEMVTVGGIIDDRMVIANPGLRLSQGATGVFLLREYTGADVESNESPIWWPMSENASFVSYSVLGPYAKDIFEDSLMNLGQLYNRIEAYTGHNFIEIKPLLQNVQNRLLTPAITNISPLTVTAGNETLITITGTGFGATEGTVFFDDADDGSGGNYTGAGSFHIQSWSDTQITVWVPSGAGTGKIFVRDASLVSSPLSSQTLTVSYNITTVNSSGNYLRTYLIDDMCDGDGGYKFVYSTNTANNGINFTTEASGAAQASFERAVSSWQTDVGFAIYAGTGCGTTSAQSPGDDNENIVSFDSDVWSLGSGVLATCYSYYSKCGSSEWEVVGLDVIVRRNGTGGITWEYGPAFPSGGKFDFESVALHELGHGQQLGHVISSGAVMHYAISPNTYNRTLGTNDIAGANDVEAVSVAYSPPLINCGGGNDFNCSRQYAVYSSGSDCAALPIELIAFSAQKKGPSAHLTWTTATELNNDYFTLERSADGVKFEAMTRISGASTSLEERHYQWMDEHPLPGDNYYRLRQTDFDGGASVSHVEAVTFGNMPDAFEIYPNPARSGSAYLYFTTTTSSSTAVVNILDISGNVVSRFTWDIAPGSNKVSLPVDGLADGIFLVQIIYPLGVKTLRFVKE